MRIAACCAGLLVVGFIFPVSAQGIADPTRPPPGWLPEDPSAKPAEDKPATREESGSNSVQLLLVGKTRRYAIVRGELVGEKDGQTRLVEVQRDGVTVQSERGRETLSLFPNVEKTPPRKPAGLGTPEGSIKKEQK